MWKYRLPCDDKTGDIGDRATQAEEGESYLKFSWLKNRQDQSEGRRDLNVSTTTQARSFNGTHSCSTCDSAQGSHDKVRVLIRHERNDEVDDTESQEAVHKDRLC